MTPILTDRWYIIQISRSRIKAKRNRKKDPYPQGKLIFTREKHLTT
jgi:hypothetical protein